MIKDFIHYYKPYKKLFLLDFTCAVIVAILELAFPVMVRSVIDNIVPSQNIQQIILVGAGLLALYAFSTTLNFIVVYMGHILGINIETDMRRELFAKVQKQSFSFFDNMKIGINCWQNTNLRNQLWRQSTEIITPRATAAIRMNRK